MYLAGIRALEQEDAFGRALRRLSSGQRSTSWICRFKAGSCRCCRGSANGKLFPSPTVRFLVTLHKFTTRISSNLCLFAGVRHRASSTDRSVQGGPQRRRAAQAAPGAGTGSLAVTNAPAVTGCSARSRSSGGGRPGRQSSCQGPCAVLMIEELGASPNGSLTTSSGRCHGSRRPRSCVIGAAGRTCARR
jgi:hypothetical protein